MLSYWDLYSALALVLVLRWLGGLAFALLKIFRVLIFSFNKGPDFVKLYGKWAVVTGSSSGIGKNYAVELARSGLNIVLISNEEDKLYEVSQEIRERFDVDTRVIVADFSLGEEEHERIFKAMADLDIGVLVNNVGTAGGLPNALECMTRDQMWTMLMVNVCAATSMAHHLLPKMKRRGRGLIVNISSITALSPAPFGNVYGASKAFIASFSEALKIECEGSGVEVQTVCPGFVDTRIVVRTNAKDQLAMYFPSPEKFVKSAIRTIGRESPTAGYWGHEIQYQALGYLPLQAKMYFLNKFVDMDIVTENQKKLLNKRE